MDKISPNQGDMTTLYSYTKIRPLLYSNIMTHGVHQMFGGIDNNYSSKAIHFLNQLIRLVDKHDPDTETYYKILILHAAYYYFLDRTEQPADFTSMMCYYLHQFIETHRSSFEDTAYIQTFENELIKQKKAYADQIQELHKNQAALLVLFVVMLNDELYNLKTGVDPKTQRFFNIVKKLPLDVLMVWANSWALNQTTESSVNSSRINSVFKLVCAYEARQVKTPTRPLFALFSKLKKVADEKNPSNNHTKVPLSAAELELYSTPTISMNK